MRLLVAKTMVKSESPELIRYILTAWRKRIEVKPLAWALSTRTPVRFSYDVDIAVHLYDRPVGRMSVSKYNKFYRDIIEPPSK